MVLAWGKMARYGAARRCMGIQAPGAVLSACICLGIELDPRYCRVIISRWEKFSGEKAIRLTPHKAKKHAD